MKKEAYEARCAKAVARRKWVNPTFEVRRMGSHWYVIQWPAGTILTSHRTEEEARETSRSWVNRTAA